MVAIIAKLKIDPANSDTFEKGFSKLSETVRAKEAGAVYYQLFTCREPGTYKVIEVYENSDALKAHMKSEHFAELWPDFRALLIEEPEVERLSSV